MACAASFDQILGLLLWVAPQLPVGAAGLVEALVASFGGLSRGVPAREQASVPDGSPMGCGSPETQSDLGLDCRADQSRGVARSVEGWH